MKSRRLLGFTLVELLVVIAIIGILVALLLPAVQAAREAARKTECKSRLRNQAVALQTYHDSKGHFPPGRAGSPRFPTGTEQHSVSWALFLTPFIEEQALWDAWDPTARVDDVVNALAMRTPVSLFSCPSRREPAADRDFDNNDQPAIVREVAAAGDYAANAGLSTRNGMAQYNQQKFNAESFGPMYTNSAIAARRIVDGLSKTFAIGEKFLPPPIPDAEVGTEDQRRGDTAFFAGDNRHGAVRRSTAGFPKDRGYFTSADASRDQFNRGAYGSEHAGMSHFGFVDGSVHTIQHDIEQELFNSMAAVGDGGTIPDAVFED
jgi:prepilin-type N-terminal cleavage/methylation domain-containing protein